MRCVHLTDFQVCNTVSLTEIQYCRNLENMTQGARSRDRTASTKDKQNLNRQRRMLYEGELWAQQDCDPYRSTTTGAA